MKQKKRNDKEMNLRYPVSKKTKKTDLFGFIYQGSSYENDIISILSRIKFKKDAILYLYNDVGWPLVKVANFFAVPEKNLKNFLISWGQEIRDEKNIKRLLKVTNSWYALRGLGQMTPKQKKAYLNLHKDYFIYLYKVKKYSLSSIANILKLSLGRIRLYFKSWGVEVETKIKRKTRIIEENKNKIIELYTRKDNPLTTKQIADKIGLADCTIQLRLKEWGIKARDYQKAKPDKVKKLYDFGYSPEQIAKQLDVHAGSIYKVLVDKFGIHHTKKKEFTKEQLEFFKYLYFNRCLELPQIIRIMKNKFKSLKDFSYLVFYSRLNEIKDLSPESKESRQYISRLSNQELKEAFDYLKDKKTITWIADKLELRPEVVRSELMTFKLVKYKTQKSLTPEVKEKIIELRSLGYPPGLIALIVKSTKNVVNSFLKSSNIKIQDNKLTEDKKEYFVKEIKRLRKVPFTVKEIAKKLNTNTTLVARLIQEYNIPRVKKVFNPDVQSKIKQLYLKDHHYSEIAKKLNLKPESVRQEVRRMGLLVKYKPYAREYSKRAQRYQNRLIRIMYNEPYWLSTIKIADILKLDKTTVRARLKRMGIPVRNAKQARLVKKKLKKAYDTRKLDYKLLNERI
jgi:DNA-binding CsgD family transcriptional regulator